MAQSFLNLPSKPKLYIMIPPPVYLNKNKYEISQEVVNQLFPVLIPKIGLSLGLGPDQIINVFDALGGARLDKWE